MQAKFLPGAPSPDDWGQIDKSVKIAIEKNLTLQYLTICIPQNFDDPKILGQQSPMDKWKIHKERWGTIASNAKRKVEFELWDDTQLTDLLTRPENRGKLWYFFKKEELTPEWFQQRVEEVAQNAWPRYTKELNVELPISKLFEYNDPKNYRFTFHVGWRDDHEAVIFARLLNIAREWILH